MHVEGGCSPHHSDTEITFDSHLVRIILYNLSLSLSPSINIHILSLLDMMERHSLTLLAFDLLPQDKEPFFLGNV